ncbi:MAG: phage holin family protein [Pseudomonadota bacterium]
MFTLLHLAALTATILLVARLLPAVRIKGIGSAVLVAVVFSVLNFLLGWVIKVALFVPALLTLGLLFLFVPFIVNTVMLWITDKLLHAFEIQTTRALLLSSGAITLVNWAFHVVRHTQRIGYY